MRRMNVSACCGLALLLAASAAHAAATTTVGTLPVRPLAKPAKAAPAVETGRLWLSGVVGITSTDSSVLSVSGIGAYTVNDRNLFGIRYRSAQGFSSRRHGQEFALLAGKTFARHPSTWWALGVSSFELEHEDNQGQRVEHHTVIGLPLELVYAPHFQHFGIELRAEANLNTASPAMFLGLGVSLGKP